MDGWADGWIAEELVCGIFTFVFSIAWQETWGGHHKQSDICLSCGGQVLFETTQVHAGVSMQMKRKAPLRNFVGDDDGEDGEGGRKGEGHVSGAYWQFHCLLDIHSYKGADWGQSTTLCNRSLLVEHILVCNPQHFATIHNTLITLQQSTTLHNNAQITVRNALTPCHNKTIPQYNFVSSTRYVEHQREHFPISCTVTPLNWIHELHSALQYYNIAQKYWQEVDIEHGVQTQIV